MSRAKGLFQRKRRICFIFALTSKQVRCGKEVIWLVGRYNKFYYQFGSLVHNIMAQAYPKYCGVNQQTVYWRLNLINNFNTHQLELSMVLVIVAFLYFHSNRVTRFSHIVNLWSTELYIASSLKVTVSLIIQWHFVVFQVPQNLSSLDLQKVVWLWHLVLHRIKLHHSSHGETRHSTEQCCEFNCWNTLWKVLPSSSFCLMFRISAPEIRL